MSSSSSSTAALQDRLQAVSSRRQQPGAAAGPGPGSSRAAAQQRRRPLELREYTHLDHLGSGVFRASLEQRQLYQALREDVRAHGRAAGSSQLPAGVVEVQVLAARVEAAGGAAAAGAVTAGLAGGSLVTGEGKVAFPAVDVRAANTGSLSGGFGRHLAGCCCRARRCRFSCGGRPAGRAGGAAGGAGEATLAAVRRPVIVEQCRRLQAAQQRTAGRAAQLGVNQAKGRCSGSSTSQAAGCPDR